MSDSATEMPEAVEAQPVPQEVPEHVQEAVAELGVLRANNSENLQKLQRLAQTDVATSISITRLNQVVDYLFGDGEERLNFEIHFEKNVGMVIDRYLSMVTQQMLTQGIGAPDITNLNPFQR